MHLITIISPLTGLLDTVEFSVNTIPFFFWLVQVRFERNGDLPNKNRDKYDGKKNNSDFRVHIME